MSDAEHESLDIDERLSTLYDRANELAEQGFYQSSLRVSREARRLASSEQRLVHYLHNTFRVMVTAGDMLEPTLRREMALELISLLESDDRARTIEPDYDEDEFAETQAWMTSCAYDNLAQGTGEIKGYNSDGMHQCITDGIAVCHRTGKLQCVTCFREYSTDVYAAADDVDMALHFARIEAQRTPNTDNDRRCVSERIQARMLLLQGLLEPAWDALIRSWGLKDSYHTPSSMERSLRIRLREMALLLGQPERWTSFEAAVGPASEVPAGENPWQEMNTALVDALASVCDGNYQPAIAALIPWDKFLQQKEYLDEWFSLRLRLLCIHRLAGNTRDLERLAEPLRVKAQAARDWLTLRLLKRVLDPNIPAVPIPTLQDYSTGPFAPQPGPAAESVESAPPAETSETSSQQPPERSPLIEEVVQMVSGVGSIEDPADVPQRLAEITQFMLDVDPVAGRTENETSWLLYFMHMVVPRDRAAEVWAWARTMAGHHPTAAVVINLQAHLAWKLLSSEDESLARQLTADDIESWFRQSLNLDPDAPRNHLRAGQFFLARDNLGEAERCLARGFRLSRDNSDLASLLAEVYKQTDRQRDALEVLDMALREGCDDSQILREAALLARGLNQAEISLTYLDRLEEVEPGSIWTQYYRALSLLDLNRPADALEAAREELQRMADAPQPAQFLVAIALGNLKDPGFVNSAEDVLQLRPSDLDVLSRSGLANLLYRLWQASIVAEDMPVRQLAETRLLETGLAPDELFDFYRKEQGLPEQIELDFYRVLIRQPLDDNWITSYAVLEGEEDWEEYLVFWGVLAASEEEAVSRVLEWQNRCYSLAPEVVQVIPLEEQFTDVPGIVWQGERGLPASDDDDDDEDEDADDDDDDDFTDDETTD